MRRVKGSGGGDKLCYCPQNTTEHRFFRPTGIYIVRTIKGESLCDLVFGKPAEGICEQLRSRLTLSVSV